MDFIFYENNYNLLYEGGFRFFKKQKWPNEVFTKFIYFLYPARRALP